MLRPDISLRPHCNLDRLVRDEKLLPLNEYDFIICSFSGGKDSIALTLQILEQAIEREFQSNRIELWHQNIDGDPSDNEQFMDWPVTHAYASAVAKALEVPLRFQWKDGGFEGELLRQNVSTSGVYFEDGDGTVQFAKPQAPAKNCGCKEHTFPQAEWDTGIRRWRVANESHLTCPECGKVRKGIDSRLKWPAKAASLTTRWCSAYLKIDVAKRAINNDPRFANANVLILTGERREESTARSKYDEVVPHGSTSKKRRVDQWRSVIDWSEKDVWNILERWRIRVHPAYFLGWGRVSCMACIFGDKHQWASVREIAPQTFDRIVQLEVDFDHTIDSKLTVVEMADRGESFINGSPRGLIDLALENRYPVSQVFVPDDEEWELPKGAFKKCGGPI